MTWLRPSSWILGVNPNDIISIFFLKKLKQRSFEKKLKLKPSLT
jgi:hypothetical protein